MGSEAFKRLDMVQHIVGDRVSLDTLRGALRIDGRPLTSPRAAPALGADRDRIIVKFGLEPEASGLRKDRMRQTAP